MSEISLQDAARLPVWRRPVALLFLMAVAMPLAFATWSALLNNFVIEEADFTGVEIGWLHTVREIPGFFAIGVIAILLFMREQTLAMVSLTLLGAATAIWAQKMDQMAAVTNFVIMPLSFLSGTFYATSSLPPTWRMISEFNPFHYLIDGFRYGVIGSSEADPWMGALVGLIAVAALWLLCWRMFATGYRLKS